MITIVNYGVGNIQAIANIYHRLGIPARLATRAEDLADADRIILPGVGAFDWCMRRLAESGMREALDQRVLEAKRPILGICVGMQMMAERSEEGTSAGLGWIPGEVRKLDETRLAKGTRLPHMGWNDVQPTRDDILFRGAGEAARFYFLHSYYFAARREEDVLAVTDYGGTFPCAVGSGHIRGVQFHPEKSHAWGVQLLKSFAEG